MSSSIGFGMQPRSKLSQYSLRFARNCSFHARVWFDNVGLSPQYSKQYVFVTSICFNRMGLSPLYSKQWVVCHLNVLNNMGLSPQYVLTIWVFTSIFFNKMGLSPQHLGRRKGWLRSAGTQTCDDNDAENKDNDAGEDGVNDDVDDEDMMLRMMWSRCCWWWCWWQRSWRWWGQHPTSGRQGPTRWGRTCKRPSAKWTWQKGFAWTWATRNITRS